MTVKVSHYVTYSRCCLLVVILTAPVCGEVRWCVSALNLKVGIADTDPAHLRNMSSEVFPHNRCAVLEQVYAGPSVSCASLEGLGSMNPPLRFDVWQQNVIRHRNQAPISRLSCLNDGISLDERSANGAVLHEVVGGNDPLRWSLGDIKCTILEVSRLRSFNYEQQSLPKLVVFVQISGPLTADIGRKIFSKVTDVLRVTPAFVKIRNDAFFIETGFPILYPFSGGPIPSEDAYRLTKTLVCGTSHLGEVGCGTDIH